MTISKDILSLAAEFAVASELCRRGIYAQLTLGKHKRTDILVETENAMLRIQVKSKQGKEWPSVKYDKDIVLVFVDFQSKKENERPDFYILINEEFRELWKDESKRQNTDSPDIRSKMIEGYKEKWDELTKIVGAKTI